MKQPWLLLAGAAALLLGRSQPLLGYAEDYKYYASGVPGRVVAAYLATDGDLNLVIVPTSDPEERAHFFRTFWFAGANTCHDAQDEWRATLDSALAEPSTGEDRARQDAACAQCLGGAGVCRPFSYDKQECKSLLGCDRCIYILSEKDPYNTRGPEVLEMALFTATVEVELPDDAKTEALRQMGASEVSDYEVCDLFETVVARSICGKKVLVWGPMMLDQGHACKPEIHPAHKLIIEDFDTAQSELRTKTLTIVSFIDGSSTSFYRDRMTNNLFSPVTTFDLSALQTLTRPTTAAAEWRPICSFREKLHHQVNSPTSWNINGAWCGSVTVSMKKQSEGAVWLAKGSLGWKKQGFALNVLGGDEMKGDYGLNTGSTPFLTGPPASGPLRRWFRWELRAFAEFPSISPGQISWDFPANAYVQQDTVRRPDQWTAQQLVAVHVPFSPQQGYEADVRVQLHAATPVPVTIERTVRLSAQRGALSLRVLNPRSAGSPPSRSASIEVRASGFHEGPGRHLAWEWKRDGQVVTAGIQPQPPLWSTNASATYDVALGASDVTVVTTTVTDGFETAAVSRLLQAPRLAVTVAQDVSSPRSIASGSFSSVPAGSGGPSVPQTVYEWARLRASAAEAGGDFPPVRVQGPVYQWRDFQYRSPKTAGLWVPLTQSLAPRATVVGDTVVGDTLLVQFVDATVATELAASVSVVDQFGRQAVKNVVMSNVRLDNTLFTAMAQQVLSAIAGAPSRADARYQVDLLRQRFSAGTDRDQSYRLLRDLEHVWRAGTAQIDGSSLPVFSRKATRTYLTRGEPAVEAALKKAGLRRAHVP